MYNKKLIFLLQISALLICASAFGQTAESPQGDNSWISADSNYFTIYYRPSADLKRIDSQIQQRTLYFDQPVAYGETTAEQRIAMRLDKLFNRVKEVLGMYPKIQKVKIKIFKNRAELREEYFRIFNKEENFRSFYINEYNTIYTSESDIDDSVIIHEMAHVIIDHYFAVTPSEKASEILASYVDLHLEK